MDSDALPTATLGDGYVTLREWAEADAPALETVCGDPAVCRFTTVPWEYSEAAARDWVARQRQKRSKGRVAAFAITLNGDEHALGTVVLSSFDWASRDAELGYWLVPAARGRGLVTRAARLVADSAFGELGILQLRLDILPDNAASLRVAERLGCTRQPDRVVREWDGRPWEMVRFVLPTG